MLAMLQLFFSKTWQFFQITWPGFNFSIGDAFLATAVSAGALTAVLRMDGVSAPTIGFITRGGNNNNIKVSNERKGDTK